MIIFSATQILSNGLPDAHARRKFVEVNKGRKKSRGKKRISKGHADEALDYIGDEESRRGRGFFSGKRAGRNASYLSLPKMGSR
jgi:hypothetical protein